MIGHYGTKVPFVFFVKTVKMLKVTLGISKTLKMSLSSVSVLVFYLYLKYHFTGVFVMKFIHISAKASAGFYDYSGMFRILYFQN